MSLGGESGKADLIRNIAVLVKIFGGYKKSIKVELENDLEDCLNVAAECFRGKIAFF